MYILLIIKFTTYFITINILLSFEPNDIIMQNDDSCLHYIIFYKKFYAFRVKRFSKTVSF